MSDEEVPVDKLIKIYIKMRDAKQAFEKQASGVEEQMDIVKGKILDACTAVGASSLRTPFGRVVRTVKTDYSTSDWVSMHQFMKENDALDLVQRRIHQTNMKTYLEEHPDKLPPGLNSDSRYDITVYRK
jgi:hypothetical protein